MEIAILFLLFFLFLVLRIPVAFSLALTSLVVIGYAGLSPKLMLQQMYQGINSFTLLAVPFFLLAGQMLNEGKVTDRLLALAQVMVGHIRGGLAHVNIVVSMLFGGMSGSSTADTAAIGSVMIPAMKKKGFSTAFSVAVTAASSTMGAIIPPSILMVVYGAQAGVSIGALFLAGAIPGILVGVGQMVVSYIYALKHNMPSAPLPKIDEVTSAIRGATLAMLVPVILIGGVLSGYFTATESGMVAVFYVSFLTYVIYRSAPLRNLPVVLRDAALMTAVPLFAVAAATVFGWLLAYYSAPDIVGSLLFGLTTSPELTLLLLVVVFAIVGTFMDPIPAIIIFMPIVSRLVTDSGADPLLAGLIIVMVLALGLITPPYGICLLLGSQIGKISVMRVVPQMLVFYAAFLAIVTLIIFVPDLALWLPRQLMPQAF